VAHPEILKGGGGRNTIVSTRCHLSHNELYSFCAWKSDFLNKLRPMWSHPLESATDQQRYCLSDHGLTVLHCSGS